MISSFQHGALEVAHDVAGDWARGLLLGGDELIDNWMEIAEHLEVQTINFGTKIVSRETVEQTLETGRTPLVFTVNDPNEARQYQSWGIKALFSDEPDVILDNLLTVH